MRSNQCTFEPAARVRFGVITFAIVTALMMLVACTSFQHAGHAPAEDAVIKAQLRPNGSMIIYPMEHERSYAKDNGCLRGDYGMMVKCYEAGDKPVYECYDGPAREIFKTSSLKSFLRKIDAMPAGATLAWYDTCSSSSHRGLAKKFETRIARHLELRSIKLQGIYFEEASYGHLPDFMICACDLGYP